MTAALLFPAKRYLGSTHISSAWKRAYLHVSPVITFVAGSLPSSGDVQASNAKPGPSDPEVTLRRLSHNIRRFLDDGQGHDALMLYKKIRWSGFVPDAEFCGKIFSFYIADPDWHKRTNLLTDIRTLFLGLVASVGDTGVPSSVLSDYLKILARAGSHDEVYETVASLPSAMVADMNIAKVVLSSLMELRTNPSPVYRSHCASYAIHIWKLVPPSTQLDAEFVESMLILLDQQEIVHRRVGVEIVQRWVVGGKVDMNPSLAFRVSELLFSHDAFGPSIAWARKLLADHPETISSRLIHKTLLACACYSALTGYNASEPALDLLDVIPADSPADRKDAYITALLVPCVAADWSSAKRVFEKMTGVPFHNFSVSPPSPPPIATASGSPPAHLSHFEQLAIKTLADTALRTKSLPNILEFLQFIDRLGMAVWEVPDHCAPKLTRRRRTALQGLAEAVVRMTPQVRKAGEAEVGVENLELVQKQEKRASFARGWVHPLSKSTAFEVKKVYRLIAKAAQSSEPQFNVD